MKYQTCYPHYDSIHNVCKIVKQCQTQHSTTDENGECFMEHVIKTKLLQFTFQTSFEISSVC